MRERAEVVWFGDSYGFLRPVDKPGASDVFVHRSQTDVHLEADMLVEFTRGTGPDGRAEAKDVYVLAMSRKGVA